MRDETKRWIEAGKLFSLNADAEIVCPACGSSKLQSEDILIPNSKVFERRIYCDSCKAENFLRLENDGKQT